MKKKPKKELLLQGNEAIVEGALRAGCRFFAGYPITPATEISELLSVKLPQVDGTFIQIFHTETVFPAVSVFFSLHARMLLDF